MGKELSLAVKEATDGTRGEAGREGGELVLGSVG